MMKKTFKPSNLQTFKLLNLQTYCLTISASDTSGGAGIQMDLKTFHDNDVRGISVITGITAQSFDKVFYACPLPEPEVETQLKTLFENFYISAVKIGVIFNLKIMKLVEYFIKSYCPPNIVIDPVLSASDGTELLNYADFDYFRDEFLKLADLVTPNIPELEKLSGKIIKTEQDIITNAKSISLKYDAFIFAKGGHFTGKIVKDFLVKDEACKSI